MPAVTRRPESTVNATKKAGCMSITDSSRDEKRTVREQTISVDCRSDSAADGRARAKKTKGKKKGSWARNGERQREEKKKTWNGKTFLSRFPGLNILPSFFSLKPTTRSMTGLASLPYRLRLRIDDKGVIR